MKARADLYIRIMAGRYYSGLYSVLDMEDGATCRYFGNIGPVGPNFVRETLPAIGIEYSEYLDGFRKEVESRLLVSIQTVNESLVEIANRRAC